MRVFFKFFTFLHLILIFLAPLTSEAQLTTDEDYAWITEIYDGSDSLYLFRLSDYKMVYSVEVLAPGGCSILDDGIGGIAKDPSTGDTWAVIEFDGACTSFDDTGCDYRKLAKIDLLTGIVDTNSIICLKNADSNVAYTVSFQFTSTGKLITYNYNRWLHEVDKNTGDQLYEYGQLEDYGPGSMIFDPTDDNVLWHHDDGTVGLIKYSLPDLTAVDSIEMPETF
ncbi:MAG: hypothetical protein P8M34_12730, partial [Saprospiraceae bacterium]|nr:hypothetical protein [Saprospiraceae bacterium]